MLVYRRQRGELHSLRDFFEAGRIAILVRETHQIIEDFLLPLGQHHFRLSRPVRDKQRPRAKTSPRILLALRNVGESKAKVNSTIGQPVLQLADTRAKAEE